MGRSNIRAWYRIAVITPLVGAACAELTNPTQSSLTPSALTGAFSTVPVGYGDLTSSFVGTAASGVRSAGFWLGGGRNGSMERGSLMGGGLQASFSGEGGGFGRGVPGPFGGGLSCTSTFNTATGRLVCETVTQNGLTIARSAQYKNAAGTLQQAFDSTTNSVNIHDRLAVADALTSGGLAPRDLVGGRLRGYWRQYDGVTRLRANVSRDLFRGLSLVIAGDNLLGQQFGEPDNATVVPGRTITAGVKAKF